MILVLSEEIKSASLVVLLVEYNFSIVQYIRKKCIGNILYCMLVHKPI